MCVSVSQGECTGVGGRCVHAQQGVLVCICILAGGEDSACACFYSQLNLPSNFCPAVEKYHPRLRFPGLRERISARAEPFHVAVCGCGPCLWHPVCIRSQGIPVQRLGASREPVRPNCPGLVTPRRAPATWPWNREASHSCFLPSKAYQRVTTSSKGDP
ncbi:S100-A4-like protein [Platysternon megacephalum]|uniref:S100-A4-like protein n=1 Tax=Platysternon megacephalum TaxID=55544 RepID=A0A4D9DSF4_9SAUR|nr:S100-A4-like protein [Platysternon megacephalum]